MLAIVMVFSLFSSVALAVDTEPTASLYKYTVLDDGSASITLYSGEEEIINVPGEIDGYTVSTIGKKAFYNCVYSKTINLPDSVKTIDTSAFENCIVLETIDLSSVESIGSRAFYNCLELKTVVTGDDLLSVGGSAFRECNALESISFSSEKITFATSAFIECESLTKVTVSDLNKWYNYIFESTVSNPLCYGAKLYDGTTLVEELVIPETVESVSKFTFFGCSSITSVSLHANVKSVLDRAFAACTNLEEFIVSVDNNRFFEIDSVLYRKSGSYATLVAYPLGNKQKTLTIPTGLGINLIDSYAFYRCENLEELYFGDDVTEVEMYGFLEAKGIKKIDFGKSLVVVNAYAFNYCTSLEEIILPDTVYAVDIHAFDNCTSAKTIKLSENLTYVANHAFYECNSLETLTLGSKVTRIGQYSFAYAPKLKELILPEGMTLVDDGAFWGATSLEKVYLPSTLETLGAGVFYDCASLYDIELPLSLKDIQWWCFNGCSSLKEVSVPYGVQDIGIDVFKYCSSLKKVDLPESITKIDMSAFYGCTALVDITIPESVTVIEDYAFDYCSSLESINIPQNVNSLYTEFIHTNSLKEIVVDERNEYYSSTEDGVLFNKDKTILYRYPSGKTETEYVIPDGVSTIFESAFFETGELRNITMLDNVTDVSYYAGFNELGHDDPREPAEVVVNGYPNTAAQNFASWYSFTFNVIHYYGNWQFNVEPTCTSAGEGYRVCSQCNDVETKVFPALGHDYTGAWTIDVSATCTEKGVKSNHCSRCDERINITDIPATGHKFSTLWEIDVEATCTEDGMKSHHCLNCSEKQDETVISAYGHCFGAWQVTGESSCTEKGIKTRKCEICEIEETEETEANEHVYYLYWSIDTPATCTEYGVKSHHCMYCDYKKDVTSISPTGHSYGKWEYDVDATCENAGSRHKECENCNDVVTQEVAALGHHYSTMWTIDIDPTCSSKGEKSHHCLRCDDKTDIEEISYGGHIFEAWYIKTEPTMDTEGVREHKCYNCDFAEEVAIPKLLKYTATFVADGDIVATVDFPEDATEIVIPEVPLKDKYSGEWENFEIRNKNFTVNAIYTPIPTDNMDGIDASNKTDYFESTGEIEVNLHAAAQEKTIITTTTKPVPLDIVFVLDQSGSMADGNKTYALKNAVTSFSNSILADAVSKNVDHRIAIVGFASGGNDRLNYENTELLTSDVVKYDKISNDDYQNALVSVNDNGVLNGVISDAIKEIDAKGATKADLGLEMASNVFANNAVSGNRQRVVVFLTDGEPTSYNGFEYGVANVAIQNAYQIKNTYNAKIYSVGIFDRATANNANVNNFMNYVSSNYNEEKVLSKKKNETTPAASGYYLDVSDVSKLSEIFTSIVEEAIIHTGEFDNVTLKYTLTKNFSLTSVQETKLRKDAIEKLGVTNEQIFITRNDDGTTTIIIESVKPWLENGEYVVDFTFRATANENTIKSGTYQANTYDSGLILEDGEGYEAVFTPDKVDIKGTSGIAVFRINNIPYIFNRLSSTTPVIAPATDFGMDYNFIGWNVPANLILNNEVRVFDAELLKNEYKISWNIDGQITEVKYAVGDFITVPEVSNNSIGGAFVGWDKAIPETMPSENLTITAIYDAHYHTYSVKKTFESCTEGGLLTYTCDCGDSYTEEIAPCEHSWEVITASSNKTAIENAGSRCTVCGIKDSKALRLEGKDTYQESDASYNTATFELDYIDENGDKHQPDGEIEISVQLDEMFEGDIPDNATANVYRVNDDGSRTMLPSEQNGMNMTFVTDHFSRYEFEFTTGEQRYLFAENGAKIDYENKLIFSNTYLAKEFRSIVSYLVPATIKGNADENGYFATGTSIDFTKDGVTDNYKVIINGDINGDGVCDVLDASYTALVSTGHKTATEDEIYAANGCISEGIDASSYQNVVNMALAS